MGRRSGIDSGVGAWGGRLIPLSCGIHEALRLIPCPVCPRVLEELRSETVLAVGSFSPIGKGKVNVSQARLNRAEVVRRAKRGESRSFVARAMGLSYATVYEYGRGHFKAQPKKPTRKPERPEDVRRAKLDLCIRKGMTTPTICRRLGVKPNFVTWRRNVLRGAA